jgi:hypothetical protein
MRFLNRLFLLRPASISTEIEEIERSRRCGGGAEKHITSFGGKIKGLGKLSREGLDRGVLGAAAAAAAASEGKLLRDYSEVLSTSGE